MKDSLPQIGLFTKVLSMYPQILEMLLANTYGKIWMIGGSVTKIMLDYIRDPNHSYKFDCWNLYSIGQFPFRDFDFLVEEFRTDFKVSLGWEKKVNTFGGIKLFRRSPFRDQMIVVDIWKLRKHEPCRRHNVAYSIENVLQLTPLTIQSIGIELQNAQVVGRVGMQAITDRTVEINNLQEAQNYCRIYKTTTEALVMRKAKEYNFTPIL